MSHLVRAQTTDDRPQSLNCRELFACRRPSSVVSVNKNAAAPYWGDGGRGSTQLHRQPASGDLDWADNGAWPGRLSWWADDSSALGGKPWVHLNRSVGRSRVVFVALFAAVALSRWQSALWRALGDYSSRSTHSLYGCDALSEVRRTWIGNTIINRCGRLSILCRASQPIELPRP